MCWELQCVAICRVLLYVVVCCLDLPVLVQMVTISCPTITSLLCVAMSCCMLLCVTLSCCMWLRLTHLGTDGDHVTMFFTVNVFPVPAWPVIKILWSFSAMFTHFSLSLSIFAGSYDFSGLTVWIRNISDFIWRAAARRRVARCKLPLLRWGMVSRTFRVTGLLKRHVYLYKV